MFLLQTWARQRKESGTSRSRDTVFMILRVSFENRPVAQPVFPFLETALRNQDAVGVVSPGCGRTSHNKSQFHSRRASFEDSLAMVRFCSVWDGEVIFTCLAKAGSVAVWLSWMCPSAKPQMYWTPHIKKRNIVTGFSNCVTAKARMGKGLKLIKLFWFYKWLSNFWIASQRLIWLSRHWTWFNKCIMFMEILQSNEP